MKVICIDENAWPSNYPMEDTGGKIITGQEYDVVEIFRIDNITWYALSVDPGWVYWAGAFSPVSDIDEKEFERNYNKELA